MEVVEEEPDLPRAEAEEVGLPPIPDELSLERTRGTIRRVPSSGVQRFYDARGQHLKKSYMKNTKPMEIYEISLSFKLHIN